MSLRSLSLCLTLALFASLMVSARLHAAEDWPQWRGPAGDGHAPNAKIPTTWDEQTNIRWKVPVEGEGFSSPVIADGKLWLTTALVEALSPEEEEAKLAELKTNPRGIKFGGPLTLKAQAFDVDSGKLLHDVVCFEFPSANPKHATNSYASPTPVIAGNRLFCHFGDYGTCCVDVDSGKLIWTNQELHVDHQNGPGSSPVVWKDLVIMHYDGIDAQYIAALNADDGTLAWKTPRSGELDPKPEFQKAYCTPSIHEIDGKEQLVSPGANWLYGYDPATGKELWKASYGQLGFSTVPRPVFGKGMAFICTSFLQSRLVAVKTGGASGDISETHVAWTADRQIPKKPGILFVDDNLYFVSDSGIASTLRAETGEEVWQERFPGQYSASPLYANGSIYVFNQEGITMVYKPGDTFELVSENPIDEGCMATPAISGDRLFVRTMSHLYCIAE